MSLLELTQKGLYCRIADVYIDPSRKVDKAIVTHAHADHARPGMGSYLCHKGSENVLKLRLGKSIRVQSSEYGESIDINGVRISLHPAGHIVGSAQVRLEHDGRVWVVTGDYKLGDDTLCTPFEHIKCNVFVTESTFALPVFQWPKQEQVVEEIKDWWSRNAALGRTSIVLTYSLGKAQRLLNHLAGSGLPILAHRSITKTNDALKNYCPHLPQVKALDKETDRATLKKALVLVPPGLSDHSVYRKLSPYSIAITSGWMALPGFRRSKTVDRSFIMSDHADWPGLNLAVKESGAEKIYVMHGYTETFSRWLNETGVSASDISELRPQKKNTQL